MTTPNYGLNKPDKGSLNWDVPINANFDILDLLSLATLRDVNLAGIADGQLVAWNASTGKFVPVTPSGLSEVAYAENVTGTVTTLAVVGAGTSAVTDVPGVSITVPANTRPVYLDFEFGCSQTVAGLGRVSGLIRETTGAETTVLQRDIFLPNSAAAQVRQFSLRGRLRLGVVASQRTFKLAATISAPGSNSPTVTILNATAAFPTFLMATAL